MQELVREYLNDLGKKHRKRRRFRALSVVFALIVAGGVIWGLSRAGIATTGEPRCGREEHQHTDGCYSDVLSCGMEESSGHHHTEACYQTAEPVLVCGMGEGEGHTHTDACYQTAEPTRICGQEEYEGHTHTDACYTKQLTCGKEEHQHTDECYIDKSADVEDASVWNAQYENIEWENEWGKDLVTAAKLQLDYKESAANYTVAEDGSHKGYTRYGQFDGDPYTDWDASFVNFCMYYAGLKTSQMFPDEKNTADWYDKFIKDDEGKKKVYLALPGDYEPQEGDIIFLKKENEETEFQMGIVSSYNKEDKEKNEFKVIEGNSDNQVKENTYKIDDEHIFEYIKIAEMEKAYKEPQQPAAEPEEPEQPAEEEKTDDRTPEKEDSIETPEESADFEEAENGLVRVLNCGKKGHEHTDECYNEEKELICESEEHKHTDKCYDEISKEDWERVDRVIKMIDELPTYEEIGEKLAEYDEAEDEEGYEEYYIEISFQAELAYRYYEDLWELQKYVRNSEKLLQLSWIWEATTLDNKDGNPPYTVGAVNQIAWAGYTTLVYGNGKTVQQAAGNSFYYWIGFIVERRSDGNYVVKGATAGSEVSKANVNIPQDGFILFFHESQANIAQVQSKFQAGKYVTVDFDYKSCNGSPNSNGYGKVNITSSSLETVPAAKAKTTRNNNLQPFAGVSTKDVIEINLYDFESGINAKWNSNKNYPGFQNPGGTGIASTTTSLGSNDFNFGDIVTSNLTDGKNGITSTNQAGTINEVHKSANEPISTKNQVMQKTLGADGYPALKNGTSLGYLFGGGGDGSVRQINQPGLDGLFQYDESTGEYEFNSRENHAQYNAATNKFDLYNEIISSNYLMYPFGNFLPFNDIQQAVQAGSVDRQYFLNIAASAKDKYNKESDPTFKAAYNKLANSLTGFVNGMDAETGNKNWNGKSAVDKYFVKAHNGDTNLPTSGVPMDILNKVYSIDYDDPTNFYFGMSMEMDLLQPTNGLTGPNNNSPMVFYFTGDDDVWVYIDGDLYLDLSGIHRHVGGKIDFVEGKIYYYRLDTSKGYINFDGDTPIKTVTFEEVIRGACESQGKKPAEITEILEGTLKKVNGKYTTFKDNTAHNFKFYYMERGSGSGVCRMNFNFPLLEKNSLTVGKELSVDNSEVEQLLGNPYFDFQVLEAKRNGAKPGEDEEETLFVEAGTQYDIYEKVLICDKRYSNNEHKHTDACYAPQCGNDHEHEKKCYLKSTGRTGTVGEHGVIRLKAGEYAVFPGISVVNNGYYVRELFDLSVAEQYGNVTSMGTSSTTRNGIKVGQKEFIGKETDVYFSLDGNTFFEFDNTVNTTVLGSIQLTKKVDKSADSTVLEDAEYKFRVNFDGEPVKVGTKYKVKKNDQTISMEVEEEGIIVLKADQTAEFENILAGTKYTIQETEASANGYTVTYQINSDPQNYTKSEIKTDSNQNQYVEGMISVQLKPNVLEITVNNTANGTTLEIPVKKTVSNPDGMERTYSFELQEVADIKGTPLDPSPNPIVQEIKINEQSGIGDKNFVLFYGAKDYQVGSAIKFYYQITEKIPEDEIKRPTDMRIAPIIMGNQRAPFFVVDIKTTSSCDWLNNSWFTWLTG